MSFKYKIYDNVLPYFITSTVVGWVDALSRSDYKEMILDSLRYCQVDKGLAVHAWVIMSNHIHLICSAPGNNDLAAIIRDFKKFTSRKVVDRIASNPQESRKEWMLNMFSFVGSHNRPEERVQFWQEGYHPIALDTEEKLKQRLNYLHENPVRAGIVWEAAQYRYSSAIDYYENKKGLLDVRMLL